MTIAQPVSTEDPTVYSKHPRWIVASATSLTLDPLQDQALLRVVPAMLEGIAAGAVATSRLGGFEG